MTPAHAGERVAAGRVDAGPAPPLTLPPKMTLEALADRSGVPVDTLRGYFYRGRAVPPQTRRLVAAALRRYAADVEAWAVGLEAQDDDEHSSEF